MSEFLSNPIITQYIITGGNIIAAIIVIIAAITIRRNRKHIERTTKLLGEAGIHLQGTFDSMLKTIMAIQELRKDVLRTDETQLITETSKMEEE